MLFHRNEDFGLHRFFAAGGKVTAADVARVVRTLAAPDAASGPAEPVAVRHGDEPGARDFCALAEEVQLTRTKLARALGFLQELGVVTRLAAGVVLVRDPAELDVDALADEAVGLQEWQSGIVQARIDVMRAYAETSGCRRHAVLRYFGEEAPTECDACDNCASGRTARVAARMEAAAPDLSERAIRRVPQRRPAAPHALPGAPPFAVDTRVRHAAWGQGVVVGYREDRIAIRFDEAGEKTLKVPTVLAGNLLTACGDEEPSAAATLMAGVPSPRARARRTPQRRGLRRSRAVSAGA